MKFKKVYLYKVWLILLLVSFNSGFAQLDLISSQQIDFSNAISTVSSGNWSNPSIWSSGAVPSLNDDVIISNSHTIYIDMQGQNSGQVIDLCQNLKVETNAVLQMGHSTPNFAKDLRINGSLLCNGTFSSGRTQPSNSGDGSIYPFNSRVYLRLNQDDTFISGSGYFHPRALNIFSDSGEKNLTIDLYNMVIDDNLAIKSNDKVTAVITKYAYVNIKKTLGLTGSKFQFSSPTAQSDLRIEGIVVAEDVSLFTKNATPGKTSSLTIADQGNLYVQSVNNNTLNINSEAAGFNFTIESGGLFRLGEGINFNNLLQNNANFTFVNNGELRVHYANFIPGTSQLNSLIDEFDPNTGVDVSQAKDVFGTSHIAGWYNLTDRPYLLEGLDHAKDFGATSLKTTLTAANGKMFSAYPFNHSWPNFATLQDVAEHQYVDSLFSRTHIKKHTFWTTTKNKGDWKKGPDFDHESYLNEEQQFYDLTLYLLNTYGDMDKTFVYQNWEGDWMLRGQGVLWENNPNLIPDDVDWLIEGMARMFRARQRGTERARAQFTSANAKVFHAIEFNKLWTTSNSNRVTMMDLDIPSVLEDVVTKARIDLSSWSAYDGGWTNSNNPHGHAMWKGLNIAKYFTTQTGSLSNSTPVQIGEFAINENPPYNGNNTESVIRNRYGRYIGVALSLDIPNFYLWNLLSSGQQGSPDNFTWEKGVQYDESLLYQWMDGKWVIEPDGSWGFAATFLMEQWANSLSVDNPNAIDQFNLILYPNPATDRISIKTQKTITSVTIFDVNGRRLKTISKPSIEELNVDDLVKGTYIFKINCLDSTVSFKKLLIK